jgi:hypothetical protein
MPLIISPTQDDIQTVLRSFLLAVLPAGVEVVETQDNRVPEPKSDDFVLMTPLLMPRLSTNLDTSNDVTFTASIAGDTMTVSDVARGTIAAGNPVFGVGVAEGTAVTALGTGTGGAGTYTVAPVQYVASEAMSAGTKAVTQSVQLTMQIDVHGPNSADNTNRITTLFRDPFAVEFFAQSAFPQVSPLYPSEPRQAPFMNDQSQFENRYVVDLNMQVNVTVSNIPEQSAVTANVTPVSATTIPLT